MYRPVTYPKANPSVFMTQVKKYNVTSSQKPHAPPSSYPSPTAGTMS